jgi:hypothetical protein
LAELAFQIGTHFAGSLAGPTASFSRSGASLNAVPAPFRIEFTVNVPCPRGGKTGLAVEVNGTVDNAAQSIQADALTTHTPENCGFDVHGKVVRVTGTLESSAHVNVVNGLPVGEQRATLRTLDGRALSWETSDGRSGSCALNYTAVANYTTHRATVNGSFCGATINVDAPLTTN